MPGTPEGARKSRDRLLAKNPNHFRDLQRKRQLKNPIKPHSGLFKPGNSEAAEGGRAGKRGPAKLPVIESTETIDNIELQYEEIGE